MCRLGLRLVLLTLSVFIFLPVVVTAGPTNWSQAPFNTSILDNETFAMQVVANDSDGIDTYFLNNTANFTINSSGYISNASELQITTYWLNISVNDSLGNIFSSTIFIQVNDSLLVDSDGDGFNVTTDCNDANASVNPNATEIDNDADDDCDGWPDEGIPSEVWLGTTASNYGYIEYLPENYSNTTHNGYNVLIWWAGIGRNGNGTDELDKLYAYGVPKLFDDNDWPPRNITNQTTRQRLNYSTIVMMPQNPSGIWNAASMKTFVEYVMNAYNVNDSYMYATGNSAGGIGIWRYLGIHENETEFAAVVPIFGDGNDYKTEACRFKHVAIWSHHGEQDGTITVDKSINPYDGLNNCTNAPLDNRLTLYPTHGHDDPLIDNIINGSYVNNYAFNTSYDNYSIDLYSWMFGYAAGDMNATEDADLDFYDSDVDCDESNASINPGATDVLDGVDNDCDSIPDNGFGPTWVVPPTNASILDNESFGQQVNATDLQGIDSYFLNDTTNFTINSTGYIQNASALSVGNYSIMVLVNDTYGFLLNRSIIIQVNSSAVPDTTPPTWNITPYNISLLDNQTLNVTFNATDNVGVFAYAVNNSDFNISSSGLFANVSTLVVGNFSLNISVNDTSNNSIYQVIILTVNDSNPPDTAPPTWSVTPANIARNLSVGVGEQYSATDNIAIANYSVNNTLDFSINSTGYLQNITTLIVGNYTLNITANDTSNNTLSIIITIEMVNISSDQNPPTWTIAPQNDTINHTESFVQIITATDDFGLANYSVNDTNFAINQSGGLTNNTVLSLGVYSLLLIVNDTSGNELNLTITITVVDQVAPTWTIQPSNQTINLSSGLGVQFSATDGIGIDRYEVSNVNFTINSSGYLSNATTITLKNYTLNITAYDTSNNSIIQTIFIAVLNDTIAPDTTPPTVSFALPTPATETFQSSTNVSINITATDETNLTNITLFVYNNSVLFNRTLSNQSPLFINFTGLGDGNYSFFAMANDSSNNSANTSLRWIVIDTLAPSANITSPANETVITDSSFVLYVSASEVVNVTRSVNGGANFSCFGLSASGSCTIGSLTDGTYNISIIAFDRAGNVANTTTLYVSVAIPAPSPSTSSSSGGSSSRVGSVGNSGPEEVDVSDTEQAVEGKALSSYELDSGSNSTSTLKIKSVEEGEVVLDLENLEDPVTLDINETLFYDADGDGINDTLVRVDAIIDGVASLKIIPYDIPEPVKQTQLDPTNEIIFGTQEKPILQQEKETLVDLLEEKGFSASTNNINTASSKKVSSSKSSRTATRVNEKGQEEVFTEVTIDISAAQDAGELFLIEVIPKEFAATVAELEFSQEPIVLEDDPVVMWHVDELTEDTVTYRVKKNVSITGNTVFFSQEEDISAQPEVEIPQEEKQNTLFIWLAIVLTGVIVSGTVVAMSRKHHKEHASQQTTQQHDEKPDLFEYVAQLKEENLTDTQIKQKLLATGWPKDIVNKVSGLKSQELEQVEDGYEWKSDEKERITTYITAQLAKGKSKEDIAKALQSVGWEPDAIEAGFKHLE